MSENNPSKGISLLPVLSVNFIGMLGYSIIMPFLVFLVARFGGNEFIYGVLGATYPAFQLIGAPVLGKWSDKVGRRKVLLISQAGTLLAWVIFIVALLIPISPLLSMSDGNGDLLVLTLPLLLLFIARAFDGLTGGNISVANAYLSDVSTEENRKANFGKMAMSSSLGLILGPALAGVLGSTALGELIPVSTAAIISVVAMFLIWYILPESKSNLVNPDSTRVSHRRTFAIEHKECYKMKKCEDSSFASVFRLKNVPYMLVIYFLTFMGFSFFYSAFPIFALNGLEWDTLELGMFFSLLSGFMVLVQGPVLSFLSKRVADEPLVVVGSLLLVMTFFLMSMGSESIIYASTVLFALGNGIMWPSYLSILSKLGGDRQQGAVQGVANSVGSFASIIGLILGGYFFGIMGSNTFLFTSILLLIVFLLSLKMLNPFRTQPIGIPVSET